MAPKAEAETKAFQLPSSVVGPADVSRLQRALADLHEAQQQAEIRAKKGTASEEVRAGKQLTDLAAVNQCDLANAEHRQALLNELQTLLDSAPTVTMSFAVDPSAAFMGKIVDWFRGNVHPYTLVRIGLQPTIAAGCLLRTPSKVYDFSLRNRFDEKKPLLLEQIRAHRKAAQA